MRIPCAAPTPVPTIMAVGVLSPSAHGQATTTTLMHSLRHSIIRFTPTPRNSGGCADAGSTCETKNQSRNVTTLSTRIDGTNMPATRSANSWMGALLTWASCTRFTMWLRLVSCPARVTTKSKAPAPFTVPATTVLPTCLPAGSASPVTMLSSTVLCPKRTVPSAAIRSPGTTLTTSPTRSSSAGIMRSPSAV